MADQDNLTKTERTHLDALTKAVVKAGYSEFKVSINKMLSPPLIVHAPDRETERFPVDSKADTLLAYMKGYRRGYRLGRENATRAHQSALRDLCGISISDDDNKLYVSEP